MRITRWPFSEARSEQKARVPPPKNISSARQDLLRQCGLLCTIQEGLLDNAPSAICHGRQAHVLRHVDFHHGLAQKPYLLHHKHKTERG